MLLQFCGNFNKLPVAFRKILFQTGNRLRGTDSCHYVFPLGIDQVFAINSLCASGRISGESNTGSGSIAHISKNHGLYVDCRAPVSGNIVHSAVDNGTFIVPGAEYGFYRFHQLYFGILREIRPHLVLINCLEALNDFFQIICGQICVKTCALGFLDLIENPFKKGFGNLHYHIRKHLNESAVGIVGKSGISRLLGEAFHGNVSKTQIQNRIHHAGHGCSCAGTYGNEKRIFRISKSLSLQLFQVGKCVKNLSLNFIGNLLSVVIVIRTGLCRYSEALRNGKAQIGHLCQIGALPAQKSPHVCVALLERINPFCHLISSPFEQNIW